MTATTEQVTAQMEARSRAKEKDIETKYRLLIHQMASNEPIDDEAAAITCEALGRTAADVRADVDRQVARIRATGKAANIADLLEAYLASAAACDEHLAETKRIIEARKQADKDAVWYRDEAQRQYLLGQQTATSLTDNDTPQARSASVEHLGQLNAVVRNRIAAKKQMEAAADAVKAAKKQGRKKSEISEELDAVDAARSALDAADTVLQDWRDKWDELNTNRLYAPPAPPQPPALMQQQFGPGGRPFIAGR
jgi:hypothetical protein